MLYQIKQGSVTLNGQLILDHVDFEIKGKERVAIVGKNGTGKTTLLRLIGGWITLDREDKIESAGIYIARNTTIGMLPQDLWNNPELTIKEEIETLCTYMEPFSKERFDFEQEYDRILTGFGFDKSIKNRQIRTFSGGEQTKLALIKLLLQKPDILVLDEPTNHLDQHSMEWLEEYINSYPGAVLYVSHDRFFIDQTANVIYDLSSGKLKRYSGNYSHYRKERETELKSKYKQWKAQQEERERLTKTIERFKHKPSKASMARAKKKVISRMPEIKKPDMGESYIYPGVIVPARSGSKCVFSCKKLVIGYNEPIRQIDMTIRRGQKIGIVGSNGAGKSTFLKTLLGQLEVISGNLQVGSGIDIGYFSQLGEELPKNERVIEYYQKCFPNESKKEIKSYLSRFHFGTEDYGKYIENLSGGEKAKLALCIILNRKPNVLLLDEPTNHMDIPTKEVIESALCAYEGTILFITHDRFFLQRVATSLLLFEEKESLYYAFSYSDYLNNKRRKDENIRRGILTMNDENVALLESYEAVPVKKRMQSAQLTTDQAFTDWQLDLAAKELDMKRARYEKTYERLYDFDIWSDWEEKRKWMKELDSAEEEYLLSCLSWYDKYLDYESEFEKYYQ